MINIKILNILVYLCKLALNHFDIVYNLPQKCFNLIIKNKHHHFEFRIYKHT